MRKSVIIGLGIVLPAAVACLATGHEGAATVVGVGGAFVVVVWHKVLGKLGVRSPR